jgi:hypothetical protein
MECFVDAVAMLGIDARKGAVQGRELKGVVEGEFGGGGGVSEEVRALGALDGFSNVYPERRASPRYRGVNFFPRRDRRLACSSLFFLVVDLRGQNSLSERRSLTSSSESSSNSLSESSVERISVTSETGRCCSGTREPLDSRRLFSLWTAEFRSMRRSPRVIGTIDCGLPLVNISTLDSRGVWGVENSWTR